MKFLLAGLGQHGQKTWCEEIIPWLQQSGRAQLAGVIDIDSNNLSAAREILDLKTDQCFQNFEEAFEAVPADFLIDATPFPVREDIVTKAMARGLDVFMEKPVCGDLQACSRLLKQGKSLGRKLAVNMTNHFFQDKQSFDYHLHQGLCGKLDYLFTRFS